ncbi:MAG: ispD [Herbinix sp.]|jgi:2-C-methyl-D-erythritol 4-phosphate cytidylyltransferase|nr:ispD [Herbinix sp.]
MKGSKVTAIVLAAGQGKRMNSTIAKQFLMLKDKPVLYYSLKAFEKSSVDEIILVTGTGQTDDCKKDIIDFYQINKVTHIIEGGKERYNSVYNALICAESSDYVLIHDGARPFITAEAINHIMTQVKEYKACILGTPVKDTIKTVDSDGFIVSTPDRRTLWSAQTPQAFLYDEIREAYERFYKEENNNDYAITDDAMVYETFMKQPVKMIMGDYQNIKITVPEDLGYAKQYLEQALLENA